MENTETCTWKQDIYTGAFDTQCNQYAYFIEGDPNDKRYKFCPYCGKPLKLIKATDDSTN